LICALSLKYAHMHQCQKACTSAKKHAPVEWF
jgi:hypothetical protein